VRVCVAEYGDYDDDEHGASAEYIAQCKMLPKQSVRQLNVIADIHQTLMYVLLFLRLSILLLFSCHII